MLFPLPGQLWQVYVCSCYVLSTVTLFLTSYTVLIKNTEKKVLRRCQAAANSTCCICSSYSTDIFCRTPVFSSSRRQSPCMQTVERGPQTQSIRSVSLSVHSSELGPPTPHPKGSVATPPPPIGFKEGRHTCLGGRGGGDPISTKGQALWYSVHTIIPRRRGPQPPLFCT